MIGLVIKDFLCLRKTMRTYLLMVALYSALAFAGAWSADIVGVLMVVMVGILPMNAFSFDQQAKWDTYGLALPLGRTKTVAARYVGVLLLLLFSVGLTAISGAVLYAAGRVESTGEFLVSCTACGLVAVLMNAVMLPLLYKFGPEQARIMLYALLGLIVFCGWLLLVPLGGIEWLQSLGEPTPAQIAAIPAIAALAALILLALSFLLSRHFYGAKDV